MAWVRIHDAALSHPKIVGIFDWRDPLHVWFWGLSYCQAHLTDGLIVSAAVPKMALKAASELVTRNLWAVIPDGWQVHDYLDWNDSRELVTKKRTEAKDRMRSYRERSQIVHGESFVRTSERTSQEVLRGSCKSTKETNTEIQEPRNEEKRKGRGDGAMVGSLPKDHLSHAMCDDSFSRCVPDAVHAKLVGLLAPKYRGDRELTARALFEWYPTVWASLPSDFVMGDAFKFWQPRFDAAFASSSEPAAPRLGKQSTRLLEAVSRLSDTR